MLKYFMRYKPGWWILHIIFVALTFYLGHIVNFAFQKIMNRLNLLVTLFLLAAAGFILHFRIHNYMVVDQLHPWISTFNASLLPATFFALIDVLVVTVLFMSRKTAVYGYMLNGLLVIYGTILMTHYSLAEMAAKSLPVQALLFKSTLPDILIAWGDFFVGKALYDSYMKEKTAGEPPFTTK